MKLQTLFSFTF